MDTTEKLNDVTSTGEKVATTPAKTMMGMDEQKLKTLGKNVMIHVVGLGVGIGVGHLTAKAVKAEKGKYMLFYLGGVLSVYTGYTAYNLFKK